MLLPAAIYAAINSADATAMRGWAIPAATDIAFALGVLNLLGRAAPASLKVLLTAIAIIDDLGAIVIIAAFYTEHVSIGALALAGGAIAALIALNAGGVRRLAPYLVVGVVLWVCVLKSGVHATLAGVVTGLAVPLSPTKSGEESPLHSLEHALHPWVAFLILPAFAFANAGVSLEGMDATALFRPVTLGIALGLFLGKQLGIFGAVWLAIRAGICRRPEATSWAQIYGLALLCGVGFTMSLFIGGLAFDDVVRAVEVRLGVIGGSLLAAVAGAIVLKASAVPR
jgi:NhaA family Na+:H+ antiporter